MALTGIVSEERVDPQRLIQFTLYILSQPVNRAQLRVTLNAYLPEAPPAVFSDSARTSDMASNAEVRRAYQSKRIARILLRALDRREELYGEEDYDEDEPRKRRTPAQRSPTPERAAAGAPDVLLDADVLRAWHSTQEPSTNSNAANSLQAGDDASSADLADSWLGSDVSFSEHDVHSNSTSSRGGVSCELVEDATEARGDNALTHDVVRDLGDDNAVSVGVESSSQGDVSAVDVSNENDRVPLGGLATEGSAAASATITAHNDLSVDPSSTEARASNVQHDAVTEPHAVHPTEAKELTTPASAQRPRSAGDYLALMGHSATKTVAAAATHNASAAPTTRMHEDDSGMSDDTEQSTGMALEHDSAAEHGEAGVRKPPRGSARERWPPFHEEDWDKCADEVLLELSRQGDSPVGKVDENALTQAVTSLVLLVRGGHLGRFIFEDFTFTKSVHAARRKSELRQAKR